jgi:peptidyl-prolyl cis-trans isomerase C
MELIKHKMRTTEPEIEVRVNERLISEEAIGIEMQYHPAGGQEEARDQAATALVIRELLLLEAERLGIDEQNVKAADNETPEQACVRTLLDREIKTPEPDEQSCRTYYDNNTQLFKTSALYEVRHILLAAAPDDLEGRDAARKLAGECISSLQEKPEHFAELTRLHSACPSKDLGGSLGQISKGQTTPEFEKQLSTMGEGLSEHPIESRYGLHVIHVDRHIEGKLQPFEHVRQRIVGYLKARVQHTATSQYLQQLVGQARIVGIEMGGSDSPLVQ